MTNLMEMLQNQLSGGALDVLTDQLPGASKEQTNVATQLAMTTLLNALAKNAAKPDGRESLANALEKDHDGGILNNITEVLQGRRQEKAADGMGILSHLLGGNNIFNVVEMISKTSGTSRNNSMNILMKVAPLVLGALGKQKKEANLNSGGIFDFLNNSVQETRRQAPEQDLISKILDRDNDGSAIDDIAGMGMKVLGNLFRK